MRIFYKQRKKTQIIIISENKKIRIEPGEFCWQEEIVLDIADNVAGELFHHLMNFSDIVKLSSAWL